MSTIMHRAHSTHSGYHLFPNHLPSLIKLSYGDTSKDFLLHLSELCTRLKQIAQLREEQRRFEQDFVESIIDASDVTIDELFNHLFQLNQVVAASSPNSPIGSAAAAPVGFSSALLKKLSKLSLKAHVSPSLFQALQQLIELRDARQTFQLIGTIDTLLKLHSIWNGHVLHAVVEITTLPDPVSSDDDHQPASVDRRASLKGPLRAAALVSSVKFDSPSFHTAAGHRMQEKVVKLAPVFAAANGNQDLGNKLNLLTGLMHFDAHFQKDIHFELSADAKDQLGRFALNAFNTTAMFDTEEQVLAVSANAKYVQSGITVFKPPPTASSGSAEESRHCVPLSVAQVGAAKTFAKQTIRFHPPFKTVPQVCAVIKDLKRPHGAINANGLRFAIAPVNITAQGFEMELSSWGGSELEQVGVSWIAWDGRIIQWHSHRENDVDSRLRANESGLNKPNGRVRSAVHDVTLDPTLFPEATSGAPMPQVFVGLSAVDVELSDNARLVLSVEDINHSSFKLRTNTWYNTSVNYAAATWIAIPGNATTAGHD